MKNRTLTKEKLQVLIKESGVTSYACIQSILSYFNYEVITKIRSIDEITVS